jgi:serine/threonine protein kinase
MERALGGLRRRTMTWGPLRAMLLAVLDGLAHAHARGVIHRDIKPANILLFPGEGIQAKLGDFGIAWAEGRGPVGAMGTPSTMAPEQIEGDWRSFGPWTDLYALGCMAWRLATGRRAYGGQDSSEVLRNKLVGVRAPFLGGEGLPAGLGAWLASLTARDPGRRPQHAADAAHGLRQLDGARAGAA